MNDNKGRAFVRGGFGCLAAFLVIGILAVMVGGRMHIDAGGACCLFVVGGLVGLVVLSIYRKGYTEGRGDRFDQRVPPPMEPRPRRVGESDLPGAGVTACPGCGASVNLRTGEGVHAPEDGGPGWVCDYCRTTIGRGG